MEWSKKNIALRYINEIKNPNRLHLDPEVDSVFHLFVVTTKDRDGLQNYLSSNNIGTVNITLFLAITTSIQKSRYKINDFPNTEYLSNTLSIPIFPELENLMVDR